MYRILRYNQQGRLLATCAVFLSLVVPIFADAATVYFDTTRENIYKDDVFVATVRISNPDRLINAIDGHVLYDENKLEVRDISIGGSVFNVWPKFPKFLDMEGSIHFIGGVPGGFIGDEEAEVFRIFFLAKEVGDIKLDFNDDLSLYLNDSKGTKLGLWLRPATSSILERPSGVAERDAWQDIISEDTIPPDEFEINLKNDPLIFDNKYFLNFMTPDRESGIDHYEVKEGEGEFTRAESPYVLKDQKFEGLIKVKAVDKAGNERVSEISGPGKKSKKNQEEGAKDRRGAVILSSIILALLVLAGVFYIGLKKFKQWRDKKS